MTISSRILVVVAIAIAIAGYGWYRQYSRLTTELTDTQQQLASTTAELTTTTAALIQTQNEKVDLANQLQAEQNQRGALSEQIGKIAGTVGVLDKLSKTDPELLKKYSKVYFLNENYYPSLLVAIDPKYVNNPTKTLQIRAEVWSKLVNLLAAATATSLPLQVESAYRSFDTQASLKSSYRFNYGAGTANQFSAEQGYSEHQLGTTVDFTIPTIGPGLSGFDKTTAYQWLLDNAYHYGFILSYPKQNTYYQFEPWHWRYVGVALATQLHADNKYFYDLDQKEIDKYLVNIFD